mgnify:CR=1 FL=1
MRKWLKVEKRKPFSYNHVNSKHKKIDWGIRITFLSIFIIGFFINISREPDKWFWFLEPWFLLTCFIFVLEVARAAMEWKYAENPKAYIVTISQVIFYLLLLFTLFKFDIFSMV